MIHRSRALQDDRGQSLVEFALILPALLLLMVGIVDFGRAFQNYVALGDMVRQSAREAAVHGAGATVQWGPAANDASVTADVRQRAVGLVSQNVVVTSAWPEGDNSTGSQVTVAATYTFRPIALMFLGNVTVPLSATTTTRILH